MTIAQTEYLNKLELALAHMIYDGNKIWAKAWGPVVEWLQREEPVIAVLQAEDSNLDPEIIDGLRKMFEVKKWS